MAKSKYREYGQCVPLQAMELVRKTTHQRSLASALNTVQPNKEWWGLLAFGRMLVLMCLDTTKYEGHAML